VVAEGHGLLKPRRGTTELRRARQSRSPVSFIVLLFLFFFFLLLLSRSVGFHSRARAPGIELHCLLLYMGCTFEACVKGISEQCISA